MTQVNEVTANRGKNLTVTLTSHPVCDGLFVVYVSTSRRGILPANLTRERRWHDQDVKNVIKTPYRTYSRGRRNSVSAFEISITICFVVQIFSSGSRIVSTDKISGPHWEKDRQTGRRVTEEWVVFCNLMTRRSSQRTGRHYGQWSEEGKELEGETKRLETMTPPKTALGRGMIGRNAEQVRIAQVFASLDPATQVRRSPTVKCWRGASLQIDKLSNVNTEKIISFRLVTTVSHQISSICGDSKSYTHVFVGSDFTERFW